MKGSRRLSPFTVAAAALAICWSASSFAQTKTNPFTPTTQPGSSPTARKLTLDDAVNLALRNSKALRVSAEGVIKARGRVNEARAAYLPTINSDTTFTRLDEGSSVTFPGPTGDPQTIPLVRQDQKTVGIVAAVPLDIVGQIGAAVSASEFQEIAARLDYNRTRNQVVLDVKNAYFDVLRARAFVGVVEQALQNAKDRLSTAEAYLRAGTGTRFDVLRAETEVANAQQNVISARNRVNLATAVLNNVLNLDQNTPIETEETSDANAGSAKSFDDAVSEAYKMRPEILQSDALIRAAEKGVTLAHRSVMPSVSLAWNFQYAPDAGGFSPKQTSWSAFARVSLPIFDAGVSRARIQQARADVDASKINKQITMDTVALEIRQAYLSVVEAQERLNVTTAALTQAQEQYRLAQVRFKEGVTLVPGASPLLEISDAQTALTQAQVNQINARYDLQNARARLDRAIGRYAFDGSARPGLPGPSSQNRK
jgi:outer membrane protein TolC